MDMEGGRELEGLNVSEQEGREEGSGERHVQSPKERERERESKGGEKKRDRGENNLGFPRVRAGAFFQRAKANTPD